MASLWVNNDGLALVWLVGDGLALVVSLPYILGHPPYRRYGEG